MRRVFDCVILAHWGEMGLLEARFRACQGNPDVTHVICECTADPDGNPKAAVFPDSDLAGRWRGRWNYVKVEAHEITGEWGPSLREFLRHGLNGNPDDLVVFSDIRDIPEVTAGVPRRSVARMAGLVP